MIVTLFHKSIQSIRKIMKKGFALILILIVSFGLKAQNLDSILVELDRVLDRRDTHFMAHEHSIDSAKIKLAQISDNDLKAKADAYNNIFQLYKAYQGDSANVYAEREASVAFKTNDPELIVRAQMNLLHSKISGGVFSEAVDIVRHTDLSKVSNETKGNFYFLCYRLYNDMSNYADGTFTDENSIKSRAYCDSVQFYLPKDSYLYNWVDIFKVIESKTNEEKIAIFTQLRDRPDISLGEKATIVSIIGDIYTYMNNPEMCAYYKAQSAIYDIIASKRETTSKNDLARLMFESGDIERANRYIQLAYEDANFFNARHRKWEITRVMHIIENAKLNNVEEQRSTFLWIAVGLICLAILLSGLIVYIFRQKKKVDESRALLAQRNKEIEKAYDSLEKINGELQEAYGRIEESNRIKDEYIGFGFSSNSEYVSKLESLYKLVKRKLKVRQYDDLENQLKDSDIRREKEAMKANFDEIFLRLFPTFIDEFNSLFPEGQQTQENIEDGVLTPEMRIFALIRLGITDSNDIAKFLNYSVNTINTYKTKTKNRSNLPNEQFEARIMAIQSEKINRKS